MSFTCSPIDFSLTVTSVWPFIDSLEQINKIVVVILDLNQSIRDRAFR
jgi:hypothetical protein